MVCVQADIFCFKNKLFLGFFSSEKIKRKTIRSSTEIQLDLLKHASLIIR